MGEALPVPAQLEAQLNKCTTVRNATEYYKPRTKTPQEMEAAKAKLPPLPTIDKK